MTQQFTGSILPHQVWQSDHWQFDRWRWLAHATLKLYPLTVLEVLKICLLKSKYQSFFLVWKHHKCLSYLFPTHLTTYVMGLRPLVIFHFFQCGDRLYTSECDVYRRYILTYKDGPRTERVKHTYLWWVVTFLHYYCYLNMLIAYMLHECNCSNNYWLFT